MNWPWLLLGLVPGYLAGAWVTARAWPQVMRKAYADGQRAGRVEGARAVHESRANVTELKARRG